MTERNAPEPEADPAPLGVFGLETDPFLDHDAGRWFFADPVLMQRIDLLLHLLQFGDTLILVTGPPGSGKSTLLRELHARLPEHWQAGRLAGGQLHSDAELVAALGHDFAAVRQEEGESFGDALLRHAQGLQQQGGLAVVLVDDADRLDDRSLRALLTLGGDPRATCRHLRILLFGAPELEDRLVRLGLHRPQAGSLQSLEMPRFDEQQCAAYLMYRLAVAGYSGESPFSATEIRALYKRSEGWPGPLNALASEALHAHAATRKAERAPATAAARRLLRKRRPPAAVWAAAAATLAAVAGLLWLWQRGQEMARSPAREVPVAIPPLARIERQPPSSAEPAAPQADIPPEPSEPLPESPSAEAPPAAAAMESGPALPPEPAGADSAGDGAEAPVHEPAPPRPPVAPPEETAAPAAEAPPAETAASTPPPRTPEAPAATELPSPPAPPAAATSAAPQPATEPSSPPESPEAGADGTSPFERWRSAQPADHFTLQLLGVRDREAAERFLAASGLDPAVTGIVETRYRGGPWYVVIHGSFPDRASARAAIESLPPRVRRNRPWPRTFGSL